MQKGKSQGLVHEKTRCCDTMICSDHNDPELRGWLRWASEEDNAPAFVRTVAQAALIACRAEYALLRPGLLELKRRHSEDS
jgi:hypothetical protein